MRFGAERLHAAGQARFFKRAKTISMKGWKSAKCFPAPSNVSVLPDWCGAASRLVMLMQPYVRSRHFFTFPCNDRDAGRNGCSVTAAMHAGPGFGGLVQSISVPSCVAVGVLVSGGRAKTARTAPLAGMDAQPAEARPWHALPRGHGCSRSCQRPIIAKNVKSGGCARTLHQHYQHAEAAPHHFREARDTCRWRGEAFSGFPAFHLRWSSPR